MTNLFSNGINELFLPCLWGNEH